MKSYVCLLLLLLPLAAAAQSSLPPCPATGYKHDCYGTFTYAGVGKHAKYTGEFKYDKPNGQGTLTHVGGKLIGEKYVGEFKDGWFNGQGTYTFADGATHVGEYKDDKFNGLGRLTLASGARHVGEWRDNLRNGQGIEYRADGTITASGQWADGKLAQSFALDTNRFPFNAHTQTALAQPTSAGSDRAAAEAENAGKPGYYTVRPGDTVVRIALDAGQHWRDIVRWNNLGVGLGLEVGQVLRIKPPVGAAQSFTVASGGSTSAGSPQTAPSAQSINAGSNAIAVEVQAARQRQQELEQRLAAQVAEAEAAKRRQQELEAQLATVQSTAQPTPQAGATTIRSAHALVIGNAAYPGSGRLDNPVNDANAMSQKLRSMGFTVTTVTDANRQRLVQAMAQFRRSAAAADLSLLFYSGHGVQIFGTNYILPTDVDQTDTAQATIQGVRLNEVIENFMPGKTKIVFLDACRDNPLQRTGDRSVTKGLAPISVAEGTLISYATKDGQVAADGVGSKNSPFTQALLEHLADPQDIGVVLRKVREKVMRATGGKQQPWDYGSLTGGELVLSRVRANKP